MGLTPRGIGVLNLTSLRHLTFCNIWDLIITGSLPSAFENMQINVEIGHAGKTIHLEVKISDTNCFFLKRSYDVPGSSHILDSPLLLIQFLPFLHTIAGVLLLLPLSNITVAPTQMTPHCSLIDSADVVVSTLPPVLIFLLTSCHGLDSLFVQGPSITFLSSVGGNAISQFRLLHQALVTSLIQETDSMAEKSRDTLRLLISGSSQLHSVLANVDGKQNLCAAGSRGLYEGATDVNHAIANSIAAMVATSTFLISKRT
ncbi:hypothetical protein Tco_0831806 [Tanacetum coccineum]